MSLSPTDQDHGSPAGHRYLDENRQRHDLGRRDCIELRRTIAHPWEDLFNLVLDVKTYPSFVPLCRDVRVIRRSVDGMNRTVILSRMTVGFPPVEVGYTNRTLGDAAARRVEVESIDGPLRKLHVVWQFEPHDEHSTDILFSAKYEFRSATLAALFSGVFGRMFGQIMDAFEKRANLPR